jgi:anti-anti-sigma factor
MAIQDLQLELFTTATTRSGRSMTVCLKGNADLKSLDSLKGFVDAANEEALQLGIQEVVIDMNDLYFMNSSCLSLLMRWVVSLRSRDEAQLPIYKIRFRANPNIRWQRRSLQAICAVASDYASLE